MSVYSNPVSGNIPEKSADNVPMTAVRVDAHKEGKTNNLEPINRKGSTPAMGKLGIQGDGRQK